MPCETWTLPQKLAKTASGIIQAGLYGSYEQETKSLRAQ